MLGNYCKVASDLERFTLVGEGDVRAREGSGSQPMFLAIAHRAHPKR